jgi:hypothetical protein
VIPPHCQIVEFFKIIKIVSLNHLIHKKFIALNNMEFKSLKWEILIILLHAKTMAILSIFIIYTPFVVEIKTLTINNDIPFN